MKPNRDWPTEFDPEAFALMVLTPRVQDHLLGDQPTAHWHIGAGAITCVTELSAKITPEDVTEAIDRHRAFVATLDPDLASEVGDKTEHDHWE